MTLAGVDVRGRAPGEGSLAVVLLHGRDQDPDWMHDHVVARLEERLAGVPVTWVAPAAPGRSWYAGRVHDALAGTRAERDRAAARVDALLDALAEHGHRPGSTVLAGFSQGACLVADQLLRHPRPLGAAIAWTGAAFGPPDTDWPVPDGPPPLAGLPVLLGNGDADAWVPLAATERLAGLLRERGAEVELRVQPGRGHEVADDEIASAAALLRRVVPRP